ncbi:MAG: helix-turn-helix transcriptional regulator [Solibacillus sp.]
MNLQRLLISLRKEETIPAAAKRMGISANYYRYIEQGFDPYRNAPIKPSPTILKKIADAYKVDYAIIATAAGLEIDEAIEAPPFSDDPILHQWYKTLPTEDTKDIVRLYEIWLLIKGGQDNVL